MPSTTLSSRFLNVLSGLRRFRKSSVSCLILAGLSGVVLNAQTASNYIVGYWEGSGDPNVSHLTHLNYAFASIVPTSSTTYTCQLNASASTLSSNFRTFKASNPNLKILISIGGAGQAPADFSNASQDPNFASNCVAQTLGLLSGAADGLDIDWEFPGSTDQSNFTNLVTNLRSQLPADGLLTVALGMGPTNNGSVAQNAYTPLTAQVLNSVSFFNVMTYDAYSTAATTFGAPLYPSNLSGYGTWNGTVNDTITDLINRGAPAGKLVLGIPFYGIGYLSVPTPGAIDGLYQTPQVETIPDPSHPGQTMAAYTVAVPYSRIVTFASSATASKFCDTGNSSPTACPQDWGQQVSTTPVSSEEAWIYDSNSDFGFGPSVITFDDTGTIVAKVNYALSKGLGGVMVWELMQDTPDTVLLNTIANSMPKPATSSDLSTYNFEKSTQGWTTRTNYTTLSSSTGQAFLGTHSLQVAMGAGSEYSPTTVVYVASPAIRSSSKSVTFHIWIPGNAQLNAINPFIADRNWNYLAGDWTSGFTPNAWNTFQISIPSGSKVAYLGVEIDSSSSWQGSIYIDSVSVN